MKKKPKRKLENISNWVKLRIQYIKNLGDAGKAELRGNFKH